MGWLKYDYNEILFSSKRLWLKLYQNLQSKVTSIGAVFWIKIGIQTLLRLQRQWFTLNWSQRSFLLFVGIQLHLLSFYWAKLYIRNVLSVSICVLFYSDFFKRQIQLSFLILEAESNSLEKSGYQGYPGWLVYLVSILMLMLWSVQPCIKKKKYLNGL